MGIQLLEYSRDEFELAYYLNQERQKKLRANRHFAKKNVLVEGIFKLAKRVHKSVILVSKNFIKTAENLIGKMQKRHKLEEDMLEIEHEFISQNPLMSGLLTLNSRLA